MKRFLLLVLALCFSASGVAQDLPSFQAEDIFELEYASDPQISPDGKQVAYMRNYMDIMTDRVKGSMWLAESDGSRNRPIANLPDGAVAPTWSPSGDRLIFHAPHNGKTQLYVRWMDSGENAPLTRLQRTPGRVAWSPDGAWLAFTMFVPTKSKSLASMPAKPEGAEWAKPARVIDRMIYRSDGSQGFVEPGYRHLFVLPADGGTPRQLTEGDYNYGTPSWSADGQYLIASANRHENRLLDPRNSEIHEVAVSDGGINTLTDRAGPDNGPRVSPDGAKIAYVGFDDEYLGYQVTKLYVMDRDGGNKRLVSGDLDRDVNNHQWSSDSRGIYFQYDTEGNTKLAYTNLRGKAEVLAGNVGGLSLGRPYGGGQFTVAGNGAFAYTYSTPAHPADIAVGMKGTDGMTRLTNLNDDLFGARQMAKVEEIWYPSSFDDRQIQGWIAKPPNFDPGKKYPLILEIHGGPFANYGDRFSSEVQLLAAAGYVVLYTNPRGSTSYGAEFGNLIHHNYPGEDYDDLMSGVDALLEKGYIDEEALFITGGSGGGVLTSWSIGKTDRFAAAVVAKPVINWYSFVLTSDNINIYYKYWFPGLPWENEAHYMKRSPISLVGNVTTPTMLLTGEADYRTPMSETEQYYAALQLQGVESVMVRIPDAPHGIARRPSNLIAKMNYVIAWFERYLPE